MCLLCAAAFADLVSCCTPFLAVPPSDRELHQHNALLLAWIFPGASTDKNDPTRNPKQGALSI